MIYIVLFECDNRLCIMADNENSIMAFETLEKGLNYFESAYNRKHSLGYEASMSACISFMQYRPSVIMVDGLDEIRDRIADVEPHLIQFSGLSGRMKGITTRPEAKEYFDKGSVPKLIAD